MRFLISLSSSRQQAITDALRSVMHEYKKRGITAYQMNNGRCEDIATDVIKLLPFDGVFDAQIEMFQLPTDDDLDRPFDKKMLAGKWKTKPPTGLTWADLDKIDFFGHVWIVDAKELKHYDAECPNGVSSIFDIPFNARRIREYLRKRKS